MMNPFRRRSHTVSASPQSSPTVPTTSATLSRPSVSPSRVMFTSSTKGHDGPRQSSRHRSSSRVKGPRNPRPAVPFGTSYHCNSLPDRSPQHDHPTRGDVTRSRTSQQPLREPWEDRGRSSKRGRELVSGYPAMPRETQTRSTSRRKERDAREMSPRRTYRTSQGQHFPTYHYHGMAQRLSHACARYDPYYQPPVYSQPSLPSATTRRPRALSASYAPYQMSYYQFTPGGHPLQMQTIQPIMSPHSHPTPNYNQGQSLDPKQVYLGPQSIYR